MVSFVIEDCIRGFHIYKAIWDAPLGETLCCQPERGNHHDPYAVSVLRRDDEVSVVGHLPRRISTLCHLFLRKDGCSISCQVTGSRRYSRELEQGGLEIPCIIVFTGPDEHIGKVKRLIQLAPASALPTESKKSKQTKEKTATDTTSSQETVWLSIANYSLTLDDKLCLTDNTKRLGDQHINVSQKLLQVQFPSMEGLNNTLLQNKVPSSKINIGLQVIHDRGDHWILASTVRCNQGVVEIYDSMYDTVDKNTKEVVMNLFSLPSNATIECAKMQKQRYGTMCCGVFAIAAAVNILFNLPVTENCFCQVKMRAHLKSCLEAKHFSLFPSS